MSVQRSRGLFGPLQTKVWDDQTYVSSETGGQAHTTLHKLKLSRDYMLKTVRYRNIKMLITADESPDLEQCSRMIAYSDS